MEQFPTSHDSNASKQETGYFSALRNKLRSAFAIGTLAGTLASAEAEAPKGAPREGKPKPAAEGIAAAARPDDNPFAKFITPMGGEDLDGIDEKNVYPEYCKRYVDSFIEGFIKIPLAKLDTCPVDTLDDLIALIRLQHLPVVKAFGKELEDDPSFDKKANERRIEHLETILRMIEEAKKRHIEYNDNLIG